MTYEEVQPGQRVVIITPHFNNRTPGVVAGKDERVIAGKVLETVYVNTDTARARRLCHPSVLELQENS